MSASAEVVERDAECFDDEANKRQFLTFLLAGEEYAVSILAVQEVRGWEYATSMPNTPAYIRGVVNLRGEVVPVVDLRLRFGLKEKQYDDTTVVIVLAVEVEGRRRTMGMVVDAVSEVYDVNEDKLQPAPERAGAISGEFVDGLATMGETLIIVLSVESLIHSVIEDSRPDSA
jgi:purine-binding chemotaxis protein CheW